MKKDQRGFVLVALVSLLPALIAGGACFYAIIGFLEDRTVSRNTCRRELLNGLEKAARPMQQLLALNPLVWQLRAEKTAAMASLAAAITAGNPAGAAAATARLKNIQYRQNVLNGRQKILLQQARLSLNSSQTRAFRSLFQTPVGFLRPIPKTFTPSRPALRPDGAEPAPAYELEPDFETRQALVQMWQSTYAVRGPLQNFLPAHGRLDEVCAATLVPQGLVWKSRLIEDKF